MTGLVVRRATEEDLDAVLRLERESSTAPHWGLDVYERMVAGGEGVRRVLLVAADGLSLYGYAVGKVLGEESELESVAVAQARRRQGVGHMLCRAVMEWAEAEGARTMELEVRVGSAGARRLYGGLGFAQAGRRPAYYQEPVEDALLLRCELYPGGAQRTPAHPHV